jgi:hypothetical protein
VCSSSIRSRVSATFTDKRIHNALQQAENEVSGTSRFGGVAHAVREGPQDASSNPTVKLKVDRPNWLGNAIKKSKTPSDSSDSPIHETTDIGSESSCDDAPSLLMQLVHFAACEGHK